MRTHVLTTHISQILIFILVSFAFIALGTEISSPLRSNWCNDYGIFVTIGDCWSHGEVVFRDKFDNKGPYQFLIQAVGVSISRDKVGIYILESLNLSICLILLYLIGRLFTKKNARIYFGILAFLLFLLLTICGGNTVEEWSLPYVLVSLWLCLKYLLSKSSSPPYIYSVVYGFSFGVISLMRINNGAIIVGIVIGFTYILIRRKQYKELAINALYVALGTAIAVLPAVIYFWCNDSLYQMLYATFFYNLKYRGIWETSENIRLYRNAGRMLSCLIMIILALYYDRQHHTSLSPVLISAAVITFITFFQGAIYPHYFIMICPIIFMLCILCMDLNKWCQLIIFIICLIPLSRDWYLQNEVLRKLGILCENYSEPSPQEIFGKHFSQIPDSDMDSIYLYDIPYTYYDILYRVGHRPIGKYFTQQERVADVDEFVHDDVRSDFCGISPKWVLSGRRLDESLISDLAAEYTLEDSCKITFPNMHIYLYSRPQQ